MRGPRGKALSQRLQEPVVESKRVITNFNVKDFQKAFVKNESTYKQNNKVKLKAKALLAVVAEESVGTKKFFTNTLGLEEQKQKPSPSKQSPSKEPRPSSDVMTIDFFHFYHNAIKTRVQKKLEEEEHLRLAAQYPPTIPSVTINLDDEESHPPFLMAEELPVPISSALATPPRKLPRRRTGAQDLSGLH